MPARYSSSRPNLATTQSETLPRLVRGNLSNAVEVTEMLAQTEMGGFSEPRGLVVESAGLLGVLRRLLDPVHASITHRDGHSRAFDDGGAGACGHREKQGRGYG